MRALLPLIALPLLVSCSEKSRSDGSARSPAGATHDRAFLSTAPILAVRDLDETLEYYRDTLGFAHAWRWEGGGGKEYGGIGRGGAWLSFDRNPGVAEHVRGHLVWFTVQGVDALYAEHKAAGAKIVQPVSDRSWGCREYRVEDINGYHLRMCEFIPCEDEGECLAARMRGR